MCKTHEVKRDVSTMKSIWPNTTIVNKTDLCLLSLRQTDNRSSLIVVGRESLQSNRRIVNDWRTNRVCGFAEDQDQL